MNTDTMNILKTATCPSLSGRSTLTYNIGIHDDSSVHIRIHENTGSGIFSKDWVPLSQITVLQSEENVPITAKMLKDIFKGKSVNTVGFLIAALIAEGLLTVSAGSLRSYDRIPPAEYQRILNSYNATENPPPKKSSKKSATKLPEDEG